MTERVLPFLDRARARGCEVYVGDPGRPYLPHDRLEPVAAYDIPETEGSGAAADDGLAAALSVHVGTSGWSYDHWDGVLYPPGTPPRDRLAHYVRRFGTVELNASFYRWPRTATFASWRRRLPPGFQLAVKAPAT
jgi:Uncharacterized conserved protein